MIKLSTIVQCPEGPFEISLGDSRTMILGSCFAEVIGSRMQACGFNVCVNPFGTLYNPSSIAAAVERMQSAVPFTEQDCVQMGAGSPLICSLNHHTSFARPGVQEFLENANAALERCASFWKQCDRVIITLGTAFVWEYLGDGAMQGRPVANCLKLPEAVFRRRMMDSQECASCLGRITQPFPDKKFIFTVSPVRHPNPDGLHANTLSKATLQLGLPQADDRIAYFPAYEILMDELRDYRFYAEDLCHPSQTAAEIVWERFLDAYVGPADRAAAEANLKLARRQGHRPIVPCRN